MCARGGYRGSHAVRKSRKKPTTKITVYEDSRNRLKEVSDCLNIPVVELIYRILFHKNFSQIIDDIQSDISEDWHKQQIEPE